MTQGPLARYRAMLSSGRLTPDPEQQRVAEALETLHRALTGYRPPRPGGVLAWLRPRPDEPPRGLYIHGAVGRGKSLLMDMFFADAAVEAKRRVHFNTFMMEVHQRI